MNEYPVFVLFCLFIASFISYLNFVVVVGFRKLNRVLNLDRAFFIILRLCGQESVGVQRKITSALRFTQTKMMGRKH